MMIQGKTFTSLARKVSSINCAAVLLIILLCLNVYAEDQNNSIVVNHYTLGNEISLSGNFIISARCNQKTPINVAFNVVQDVPGIYSSDYGKDVIKVHDGNAEVDVRFSFTWGAVDIEDDSMEVDRKASVIVTSADEEQVTIDLGRLPCMASSICSDPVDVPRFELGSIELMAPLCEIEVRK